ncbi:MAG: polysaccharide biosynthesis C-terminal domain-containing protein [Ruminococcus sp.]|nr:polysaccharide biosynthesis C-terminal domain-containing protein [Ruminococcus sp.]
MDNTSNNKPQSSYKKLFSNTLVFAIGSFSSKVLVLLLIPIYTNYLTTAELGVTDVLTQIANWLIPLVTMTISEAIIRFGLDKAYDKKRVFTIGNLICAFGLAVFGIILPIVNLTGIADKYIGGYALILFVYVMMSGIKTLYTTFVRAMEKVKLFAVAGIIATFFTLFFTAMFYMVLPSDFLGEGTGTQKYLLATILSDFITTLFVTFKAKLWKYIDFRQIDREMLSTMLQYSVPLIPAQLLWLITNSSDSFMTTHYMGAASNGILSAAYKIPNIVATVYMMFGQAWNMSAITENDSEDRDRFYENVFEFNQSLLYILAGGCMLIIQPLTNIMIGEDFRECVKYSPILIYSTIFSCFTTFMGSIYLASKKTKRSLFTSLVSGVINVGLNVILIPRIGLYGPPISTVASYVTVFIIRAFDSRKLVPFKINLRKMIISNAILLCMLAILLAETNLMSKPLLYLLVLALFCAVFIINMQSISSLLFKLLPASIAEKLSGLSRTKLAVGATGIVVFIALNVLLKFIPLYIVLIAGVLYGLKKDDKRIFITCGILFAILFAFLTKWSMFFAGLLAMSIFPLVKYTNFKYIAFTIVTLDIFLSVCINVWLGIFVALLEILALVIVYRSVIIEIAKGYAKNGRIKRRK